MDRQWVSWFHEVVVAPRQKEWGRGWTKLSRDQQEKEILAAAWSVMLAWERTDRVRTQERDFESFGKSTSEFIHNVNQWLNENIREQE